MRGAQYWCRFTDRDRGTFVCALLCLGHRGRGTEQHQSADDQNRCLAAGSGHNRAFLRIYGPPGADRPKELSSG